MQIPHWHALRFGTCAFLGQLLVACVGYVDGADASKEATSRGGSGTVTPGTSGGSSCGVGAVAETVPLRRLTKYEYTNAIRALLSVTTLDGGVSVLRPVVDMAPIEGVMSALPEDGPVDNLTLFDATHLRTDDSHVLSHFQIASQIANSLANDAVAFEKLTGQACPEATVDKSACTKALLSSFGARVLRRPLSAEEQANYLELYRSAAATGHAAGIKSVVTSLLNVPSFIFHLEDQGTPVAGDNKRLALSAYEKATRLSFALTGSLPDAGLLAKAVSGELDDLQAFNLEVDRLLELPATRAHIKRFFSQWLKIPENGDLSALNRDFLAGIDVAGMVPKLSAETHDFIQHVVWEEHGGLEALLLSRSAFISDPSLAQIYGVNSGSAQSPQVELNATHAGLLTRAALLLGSNETTSPISRGVRIRRHILCDVLAPPPNINVDEKELAPIADESLYTTRQIFEHRTSLPRCQACHVSINGLGFGLEGYDTLGRFRSEEQKYDSGGQRVRSLPVDTRTVPNVDGASAEESQDAVQLSKTIAGSSKAQSCLAAQWIEYSLGSQPPESGASCLRERALTALTAQGGGIVELFRTTAREIYLAEKAL